jgi:CHASE1-domain containing sensor protein
MTLLKGTPRTKGRTAYEAVSIAMKNELDQKFEAFKKGGSEQAYREAAEAFGLRINSDEHFADNALANQISQDAKFSNRCYTVYDAELDAGEIIPGGYVLAAVFASKTEADAVLEKYRADNRYDVRPSGVGAVTEAALEMLERDEK